MQEPSQPLKGKATIAAAICMAEYQQQIPTARHQVPVKCTTLQKVQVLSQSEQTYRVSLQKSPIDGQCESDARRAAELLRELHGVMYGTS